MDKQTFINQVKDGAIQGMKQYKILASMTIAQAILESGWGESILTKIANNLFGIKRWGYSDFIAMNTTEYVNGQPQQVQANFRRYNSWSDSLVDHSKFLIDNNRYANLVGVVEYKTACDLIRQDGYATDPNYSNLLISLIEQNNLQQFDILGQVDSAISVLQKNLNILLKENLEVDGINGPCTKTTVVKFQSIMGLTQDGIAGTNTNGAIQEIFSRPIDGVKQPHYEYATRYIQFRVGAGIDGVFGNGTKVKVQNWQSANGLTPDGVVGAKTWTKLLG